MIRCYTQVRKELQKYSNKLSKKREIVVLNKTDLLNKEKILKKTNEFEKFINNKIYLISTIQKKGIEELKKTLIGNVYK